jgi:hypothetical protein
LNLIDLDLEKKPMLEDVCMEMDWAPTFKEVEVTIKEQVEKIVSDLKNQYWTKQEIDTNST